MSDLPPVTSTQHELPFNQLSPTQFELLCMQLIEARGYRRLEHPGRSGNDKGIDIVASDGETRIGIQCKRVQSFTAADGMKEIQKLRTLDPAVQPQRVIFIVTCGISREARDKIRRAWNDPDSCEFVAISELDSEVRRHHDILKRFFGLPPERAFSRIQEDFDAADYRRRTLGELTRIETTNHDWIERTGSFPFQRMLQTIEELTNPAGRLEAGRILRSAVRRSGAIKVASERKLLRICEYLDEEHLFQLDWTLRRTLSRVIGDVIGLVGKEQSLLIGRFCEPRITTRRGVLLLAEAAAEHAAAAAAIGESVLRDLLKSKHPQATWQLLKRWPLVSRVMSTGVNLRDISEMSDTGTRRMLFLSRLHRARKSNRELKGLLGAVSEDLIRVPGDAAESTFYAALKMWARLNTTVDISSAKAGQNSFDKIDTILQRAKRDSSKKDQVVRQIPNALELDSIERDLQNAFGRYQPHPGERNSEGRYGYTRHYVRQALNLVGPGYIMELIVSFLYCADEGIRWAVAAEVLNWWLLVPDRRGAQNAVLQLTSDEHPWVTREVLQQLAIDPHLCQAIGVDGIVDRAEESIRQAQARGWETNEVNIALRRVSALHPKTR